MFSRIPSMPREKQKKNLDRVENISVFKDCVPFDLRYDSGTLQPIANNVYFCAQCLLFRYLKYPCWAIIHFRGLSPFPKGPRPALRPSQHLLIGY